MVLGRHTRFLQSLRVNELRVVKPSIDRKRSPTWKIARAIANECRSSEDGDIVDKVVIVGIKSFAELESVCKPRLRISTSTVDQHLSDQNVRKSRRLMLPTPLLVVLSLLSSIYPPPLRQSQRYMLEHASRQSSSLRHRCPITPGPTSSANTSLLDRIPRASNVLPAGIATPLHGMHLPHWTCPTAARSSSPCLLKNLRPVLTMQSQCTSFESNIAEGRW